MGGGSGLRRAAGCDVPGYPAAAAVGGDAGRAGRSTGAAPGMP